MKLLQEIKDREYPEDLSVLRTRKAARALLFDGDKIPLLFVSKYNYHKLPGGGIEEGENILQALAREVKEEVGCELEVMGEVGEIKEFRSQMNLIQNSYCYFGNILSKGDPSFTEEELNEGFRVIWFNLDDAISALEDDIPGNYVGTFIKERDLAFLNEMKMILKK